MLPRADDRVNSYIPISQIKRVADTSQINTTTQQYSNSTRIQITTVRQCNNITIQQYIFKEFKKFSVYIYIPFKVVMVLEMPILITKNRGQARKKAIHQQLSGDKRR